MCNKKCPPPPLPVHGDHVQSSSMINNKVVKEEEKYHEDEEEEEEEVTLEALRRAARRSRTKTRKPKFLSLRSQLISPHHRKDRDQESYSVPKSSKMTAKKTAHRQQLNLFPLHPENQVADHQDDNVALLFHSDGGATLNGLLSSTATTATTSTTMSSDLEEESFSYYRGAKDQYYREEGDNDIVRTAMRSREREMSVETWVSYSELVDKKEEITMEDCSTSTTTTTHAGGDRNIRQWWSSSKVKGGAGLLALKLDYQEILNAWSDKGPLYIDGDFPQTVPDLLEQDHQLFQLHDNTPNGSAGNLWRVPEEEDGSLKMKTGQREASVLRYKEKRQSRLFAKRIRYQVRKLNAEKRPRMKGRFVKRS